MDMLQAAGLAGFTSLLCTGYRATIVLLSQGSWKLHSGTSQSKLDLISHLNVLWT